MVHLIVEITKVIDTSYPIFVECEVTDIYGKKHLFHDKLPIFSIEADPVIPCAGVIRCEVIHESMREVYVSTALPDAVESVDGEDTFLVSKHQILESEQHILT